LVRAAVLAIVPFHLRAGRRQTVKVRLAQAVAALLNRYRGELPVTAALQLTGVRRAVSTDLTLRR
jgi:hypothetical protein